MQRFLVQLIQINRVHLTGQQLNALKTHQYLPSFLASLWNNTLSCSHILYLHFASPSRKTLLPVYFNMGVLLYGGKALASPLPKGTLMTISSVPPVMGEPFTEMLYTFSLCRGTRSAGVLGNLERECYTH